MGHFGTILSAYDSATYRKAKTVKAQDFHNFSTIFHSRFFFSSLTVTCALVLHRCPQICNIDISKTPARSSQTDTSFVTGRSSLTFLLGDTRIADPRRQDRAIEAGEIFNQAKSRRRKYSTRQRHTALIETSIELD